MAIDTIKPQSSQPETENLAQTQQDFIVAQRQPEDRVKTEPANVPNSDTTVPNKGTTAPAKRSFSDWKKSQTGGQ